MLSHARTDMEVIRELANVYGVEKKYWEILNEERPTPQQE